MNLEQLRPDYRQGWPVIARAADQAAATLDRLRALLRDAEAQGRIDSEDVSVVVFGSLARGEWTSGSDLDWTLLIDGQADHEHANAAFRLQELLQGADFLPPGPTGVFGNIAFSHHLIHQIGGQDDTNRNTTQRMLLLLEACPVNRREAYDRVVLGILRRYLQNDFRPFRLKVPRFLLNDLHRFWRTMCVDYASKFRERAGKGWAVRIVKLRMSRKLIFAAGLVACYSCDPRLVAQRSPGLRREPTVEGLTNYLLEFVNRSPLDIVAEALRRWGTRETAQEVLTAYDTFLG
jgi:predicted nucleotidyltransferase